MSIFKKILEVIIQIALIPISAFTTATGGVFIWFNIFALLFGGDSLVFYIIASFFFAALITPFASPGILIIDDLKKRDSMPDWGGGDSYTYEETVSHDIYATDGTKVGYYETTETKEGYSMTFSEFLGILKFICIACLAFPLRIISLMLAIIACFTDKFFVMVRCPILKNASYNHFLHTYFDLVIPRRTR